MRRLIRAPEPLRPGGHRLRMGTLSKGGGAAKGGLCKGCTTAASVRPAPVGLRALGDAECALAARPWGWASVRDRTPEAEQPRGSFGVQLVGKFPSCCCCDLDLWLRGSASMRLGNGHVSCQSTPGSPSRGPALSAPGWTLGLSGEPAGCLCLLARKLRHREVGNLHSQWPGWGPARLQGLSSQEPVWGRWPERPSCRSHSIWPCPTLTPGGAQAQAARQEVLGCPA